MATSGAHARHDVEHAGTGWLIFAATMMGISGVMRILDAVWAFRYHGALPENLQNGTLGSNLHTYAWLWLVVGIVLVVSSFAVLNGSQFGRWVGIAAAAVAIISAVVWLPYYPVWSLIYVALGTMVIYALATYGGPTTA